MTTPRPGIGVVRRALEALCPVHGGAKSQVPWGELPLGMNVSPELGLLLLSKPLFFYPKATDIWGSTVATAQQAQINMHLQRTRIFLKDSSPSS